MYILSKAMLLQFGLVTSLQREEEEETGVADPKKRKMEATNLI